VGGRGRRWRRWTLAVCVTLAVHAVVLLPLLGLTGPPPPAPSRPVELDFLRPDRPPRPEPPPKTAAALPQASTPAAAAVAAATQAAPAIMPAPSQVPSAPAGAGLAGQTADGAGAALIGLGCLGNLSKMKSEQREACEARKWAGAGRRDPGDSGKVPDALIDPAKAAYYQAVIDARHAPGRPPGFGCVAKFGGGKPIQVVHPPHGLKVGPLPCYIVPPAGSLTPEADVPPIEAFEDGKTPGNESKVFARSMLLTNDKPGPNSE
jgi:hypothetical protein